MIRKIPKLLFLVIVLIFICTAGAYIYIINGKIETTKAPESIPGSANITNQNEASKNKMTQSSDSPEREIEEPKEQGAGILSGKITKKSKTLNVYTNTFYGFKIEYPSERVIDTDCFGGIPLDCFNFYTKDEYREYQESLENPAPIWGPSLKVTVFDSGGYTDVWEWYHSRWSSVNAPRHRIKVDGIEGERIRMQGAFSDFHPEALGPAYSLKGKYVFEINADPEKLLNETLESFKFIN
jgi:hypothetical protein